MQDGIKIRSRLGDNISGYSIVAQYKENIRSYFSRSNYNQTRLFWADDVGFRGCVSYYICSFIRVL